MKNRRASVCASNTQSNQQFILDYQTAQDTNWKLPPSQRTSVGHKISNMFTTKHKESPSARKIERKIAIERQKSHEANSSERHKEFVQAKSKTGINLFFSGRRRQSIAITDDAYNSALRAAKSHYDLSMPLNEGSKGKNNKPEEKKNRESSLDRQSLQQRSMMKPLTAIPSHVANEALLETHSAVSTPTTRMKLGFKDRSWTELERLWKGKAKDPPGPNIEFMLKPKVSFASDRKDNDSRAMTLPVEPADDREGESLFGAVNNHRSLTASQSVTGDTPTNRLKHGPEKRQRSKTIKAYPPRQTPQINLTTDEPSTGNIASRTKTPQSGMLQRPPNVVETPKHPKLHHKRTNSGSLMANWISSQSSEKVTNIQHAVVDELHSPFVVRKAIDLMAPNVMVDWQKQRGYSRGISSSYDLPTGASNRAERPEHFRALLDHW